MVAAMGMAELGDEELNGFAPKEESSEATLMPKLGW